MLKYLMLVVSLLTWSNYVHADQAKDLSLKLLEVSGVKEAFSNTEILFYENIKKQIEMSQSTLSEVGGVELSQSTLDIQERMTKKASELASEYFSWEVNKEELAQIYSEAFTIGELTDLIKFYESYSGQRYIEQQNFLEHRLQEMRERISLSIRPKVMELFSSMEEELKSSMLNDLERE